MKSIPGSNMPSTDLLRGKGIRRRSAPGPNIGLILNEGIALQKRGDLWRAQECYRRVLEHDPNQPDALHMMALIALEAMRTGAAVELLKRAIVRKPNDPWLLGTYADALLQNNDGAGAERLLGRAVKLAPGQPQLLAKRARALARIGREQEARRLFEATLAEHPTHSSVLFGYATLLLRLGETESAGTLYKRAHELKLDPARALLGLAECQRLSEDSAEFSEIKGLLAQPALRPWQLTKLLQAAAKISNDNGQYDEAFRYNVALKEHSGLNYSAHDCALLHSSLRSLFTPEFFARRKDYGIRSSKPVFIAGMPRSGTTLVEQIVSSHPKAAGAGELGAVRNIAVLLGYAGEDVREFSLRIGSLTARQTSEHAHEVLGALSRFSQTAERITDKLPHNFEMLGLIALLLPRAKIIHCRRSPLDTCVSCFLSPLNDSHNYTRDLTSLGGYYRLYWELMEYWRQILPLPILDLDYEEMISDPEGQSRRIIDFIGLEWDPACLDYRSNERAVHTLSRSQVRQPIYTSSIGRWRRYEKHLGPLRAALGDLAY